MLQLARKQLKRVLGASLPVKHPIGMGAPFHNYLGKAGLTLVAFTVSQRGARERSVCTNEI